MGVESFYVKIKYNQLKNITKVLELYNEYLEYSVEQEDKIHYFHKEYGAFIISPSLYYKTYRKLRKKYYRKI